MTAPKEIQEEKVVVSAPSLESEINTARINQLELKLETLSLITESMWNILKQHGLEDSVDLKTEMAAVIGARAERDAITVECANCNSTEKVLSGVCGQCGEPLGYKGHISPFDY
ncbi:MULTISPECIES: hypothetical protein [unclassified Neptuniibacter]|uniref:hypothetical protein n=1 Tax=unclassified Neptuniibacter TaxID=2630693 RepID=UPI000C61C3EA|nr:MULTISPECIES: hypothetical protein [unclassified Neptuniibacter]MAY42452.1 hypothetical protein [Oceanospirillaceae bacterium]|tara:strand:- start:37109 stop:37450 length:342 start_codon:yes stop_codon:yes gene_type:complete